MAVDNGLQQMTLASLCDGVAEERFQERIHQALEALNDHRRLKSSAGLHVVTIPIEVKLIFNSADGTYQHEVAVNPIKVPKPVPVRRPAYKRDGGLMVKPEPEQQTLGSVRPIKPTG